MNTTNLKRLAATVSLFTGLSTWGLQPAWAQTPGVLENGDFETGDLSGWSGTGDVGVLGKNVLNGQWSAFITTAGGKEETEDGEQPLSGNGAIGAVNSFLWSDFVQPTQTYTGINVSFRVRYKTDEYVLDPNLFWEDPFHAELVVGTKGALELLTIKTDGISWNGGFLIHTLSTQVMDRDTGLLLSPFNQPKKPTFVTDPEGLYKFQTHTLQLKSRVWIPQGSCDPARVKFSISDWVDTVVNSAAFIDDVKISFVSFPSAAPCFTESQPVASNFANEANGAHEGAR